MLIHIYKACSIPPFSFNPYARRRKPLEARGAGNQRWALCCSDGLVLGAIGTGVDDLVGAAACPASICGRVSACGLLEAGGLSSGDAAVTAMPLGATALALLQPVGFGTSARHSVSNANA